MVVVFVIPVLVVVVAGLLVAVFFLVVMTSVSACAVGIYFRVSTACVLCIPSTTVDEAVLKKPSPG